MRKLLITSFLVAVLLAASAPVASAQEGRVNLLEPAVLPDATAAPTFTQYLTGIFNRGLQLAGILAVVMLAYAGAEYVSSSVNPAGKEDAKRRIKNTLTGLLLALAGYLILRIINPELVTFKEGFIEPITGEVGADFGPQTAVSKKTAADTAFLRKASVVSASQLSKTEQEMRERLTNAKITVNSAEFPRLQVAGLPVDIVQDLQDLSRACNCLLSLNAGSESAGHKTHGAGKKIVDIRTRDNPAVRTYIVRNGTRCGTSSKGEQYYCIGTDRFLDEQDPPHIHAEFH